MVQDTLFGMLSGIVLAPFLVMLWLLFPLIILFLTGVMRPVDRGRLTQIGTTISLGLAIAAFWVTKWGTLPAMRSYVPLSSWIPVIPEWFYLPLRIGLPLFTTALAIYIAWRQTYARQSESAMNFILIFAAIDSLITMAFYGASFYNMI